MSTVFVVVGSPKGGYWKYGTVLARSSYEHGLSVQLFSGARAVLTLPQYVSLYVVAVVVGSWVLFALS